MDERIVGTSDVPAKAWVSLARSVARVRADISFAVIDLVLIAMSYWTALTLRFLEGGGAIPSWWLERLVQALPLVVLIHLVANVVFGTYGHVWEYASVAEALRIVLASATAGGVILTSVVASRVLFGVQGPLPLMVVVIGSMLTLGCMGAVRFRSRLFSLKRMAGMPTVERTLVIGTGQMAADLARRVNGGRNGVRLAGFVATDGWIPHRNIAGYPVLGTLAEVPELVRRLEVNQIIVASEDAEEIARDLVDLCIDVDVRLRTLPDVRAMVAGTGTVRDVRDLHISDLLPRPVVSTDLEAVGAVLRDKRVLVTGAGGSIGSEIVRQVLSFAPASVVALDHDETHLYEANLGWGGNDVAPESALCDVRDRSSVIRAFSLYRPEVVFHAAAHKHVPILEQWPEEAVKTNIMGTRHVLDVVQHFGAERFVLISTDKAVDPASVMGASKRVAEMMTQSAGAHSSTCVYSSVRFGNVLASRGSVVPTFMSQIERGGPVTVTASEMTRYFMTLDEAVQLVLQAGAMAEGGEVFVLDMGEPVRILDLANRLVRLAGMVPGRDIEVLITGPRPGEKMTEVLSREPLEPSSHPKVNIARPGFPGAITLMESVELLGRYAESGESEDIREVLYDLTRSDDWGPAEIVQLEPGESVAQWM